MRIAIVNDMFIAVEAMRRVVTTASGHQVAWVARDGAEAVRRCANDRPDVILMDLIMPHLDGVEATRQIMARTPCAIVIVTADVNDNAAKVFEAMGAGALDAVNTPALSEPGNLDGAKALLTKIETIGRLLRPTGERKSDTTEILRRSDQHDQLVAIGASAGGPVALAKVLSALPVDFPAAVVVVQHVDEEFAPGLASWLGGHTPLPVRLVEEGELLRTATVFLAAKDHHLVLTSPTRLGYTRHPADCSYQPSVDVFFKSVERNWQGKVVAVLLTGMGRDGAAGLKALRDRGHYTIAQDRATSAVFGMPKAAMELDAATDILALDKIGPRVTNIVKTKADPALREETEG
jgi:two-component system response regulator WspF